MTNPLRHTNIDKFPVVKLSQVLTESKVESLSLDISKRLRVRLNTNGVEKRPETNEIEGATKYYIRKAGQFVYGRQNLHKGAFGIIPQELDGFESSADIPAFDVAENCIPEWIDLFLKQGNYYQQLSKLASGVGSKRISPEKFLNLEIPLPTLLKQKEILNKVSSNKINLQKLSANLNHQQTLLKKLRQQILQDAIEGKLTTEWRIENPDVEPASELLKRIAAEKEKLIKDKKLKPQNPLAPVSKDEKPFDLPESWSWCRLGDISINSLGKMLDQQKNKGIPKPYLRNLNVQWHQVNTYDLKEMRFEDHETEKYTVKSGDIVICEGGYPGQAAIWRNDWDVMFQKALHRVRFISSCFDSELFVHLLWLWDGNGEIQKYFTGAGIKHLTGKSLNRLLIPLPPLVEQQAIVAKIEKLFALCDQLEAQFNKNKCHAEQLMHAVLKEAFSHDSERQSTIKILEEVGA